MGMDTSFKWCPCFSWVGLEDKEGSWYPCSLLVGVYPLKLWLCPNYNWEKNNSLWTQYLHALFGCAHEKSRIERQTVSETEEQKIFIWYASTWGILRQPCPYFWFLHLQIRRLCFSKYLAFCSFWTDPNRSICKNRWRRPKRSISFLTSVVLTRHGMVSNCSSKCCIVSSKPY